MKWNANVYSGKKCSELKCICRIRTTDNKTTSDFWQKTSTAGLTENSFLGSFGTFLCYSFWTLLGVAVNTKDGGARTGASNGPRATPRERQIRGRHNRVNSVAGVSRAAQEAASTPIPSKSIHVWNKWHRCPTLRTSYSYRYTVDIHADTSFSPEIPLVYAHAELGGDISTPLNHKIFYSINCKHEM